MRLRKTKILASAVCTCYVTLGYPMGKIHHSFRKSSELIERKFKDFISIGGIPRKSPQLNTWEVLP